MKNKNPFNKFEVITDTKLLYFGQKQHVIAEFNLTVKKGASKPFLNSLYKQAIFDIEECNKVLKLLPHDGVNDLDISWRDLGNTIELENDSKIDMTIPIISPPDGELKLNVVKSHERKK